jgi:amidase
MAEVDLHYRALTDVARDIRARRLSPVEVTECILKRIDTVDPDLRSYTTVAREAARKQALAAEREIAAGKYRSPLHGIPVAVKDVCFTRGIATTAGMAIHRDFIPGFDATVIARLAAAGVVLMGKLHMTEGASFNHHPEMPPPINPWGKELWPGVSSSGSGVATAAGLCFGSLGSDTGASIRFPAMCCGLTGVKPTWGRVSRHGIFALAETFDTVGPIARSAADAAAILGVIAGWDPEDSTTLTDPVPDYLGELDGVMGARGLRIGIDRAVLSSVKPELAAAIEATASHLAQVGAEVREVEYPDSSALVTHLGSLCAIEMAVAHEETFPREESRYGGWISGELKRAPTISPLEIAHGLIEREKFRGALNRLLTQVDVLLLPVLSMETPTWSELAGLAQNVFDFVRFTMPVNAAGAPAVSVPCGITSAGRPLGMQLIGRHCSEATLLRAAHAYQQMTDWHLRRPMT